MEILGCSHLGGRLGWKGRRPILSTSRYKHGWSTWRFANHIRTPPVRMNSSWLGIPFIISQEVHTNQGIQLWFANLRVSQPRFRLDCSERYWKLLLKWKIADALISATPLQGDICVKLSLFFTPFLALAVVLRDTPEKFIWTGGFGCGSRTRAWTIHVWDWIVGEVLKYHHRRPIRPLISDECQRISTCFRYLLLIHLR